MSLRDCFCLNVCVQTRGSSSTSLGICIFLLSSGRSVWSSLLSLMLLVVAFVVRASARVPVHCMQCARLLRAAPIPLSPLLFLSMVSFRSLRCCSRLFGLFHPGFLPSSILRRMADAAQQPNVEGRGRRRNRPLAEGERTLIFFSLVFR